MKFWPFTLKIFSQLLDKIKLFCKHRKIIKIKFRSIWSILKAFTASRNLDIYKNNVLFRKAPLGALLLISEYSSFGFYFCFSLTFSKLQTCALTWCCPGHTITILQISKLLTKRIWSIFWFITWFSLSYALTHWHPNPNWYPEISGMSWGAKISDFGPMWGVRLLTHKIR